MPDKIHATLKSSINDLAPGSPTPLKFIWISLKLTVIIIRAGWYVYENVRIHSSSNVVAMGFGYTAETLIGDNKIVQIVTQVAFAMLMLEKSAAQLVRIQSDLSKLKRLFTGRHVIYVQRTPLHYANRRTSSLPRHRIWPVMLKEGARALGDIPIRIFMMSMYFVDAKTAITTADPHKKKECVRKVAIYSTELWQNLINEPAAPYEELKQKKRTVNHIMRAMDAPWSARLLMQMYRGAAHLDTISDAVEEMEEILLDPLYAISDTAEMMAEGAQVVYIKALTKTKLLMKIPRCFVPQVSRSFVFFIPGFNDPHTARFIESPIRKRVVEPKKKKKTKRGNGKRNLITKMVMKIAQIKMVSHHFNSLLRHYQTKVLSGENRKLLTPPVRS